MYLVSEQPSLFDFGIFQLLSHFYLEAEFWYRWPLDGFHNNMRIWPFSSILLFFNNLKVICLITNWTVWNKCLDSCSIYAVMFKQLVFIVLHLTIHLNLCPFFHLWEQAVCFQSMFVVFLSFFFNLLFKHFMINFNYI